MGGTVASVNFSGKMTFFRGPPLVVFEMSFLKNFFFGKFQIFTGPPLVKTKIGFEKIFPEKFSDF